MVLFYCILGLGVHVQNIQDSCIGIHMAVCSAAFLPFTHIWHFSPGYPYPVSPAHCPYPIPPNRPECVVLPSLCLCVLIFHHPPRSENMRYFIFCSCVSLPRMMFSMSLQRTQMHHFLWLHTIPWCIYATYSLSSLLFMGIWVLPGLCYCKQCHSEHTCACVFIRE